MKHGFLSVLVLVLAVLAPGCNYATVPAAAPLPPPSAAGAPGAALTEEAKARAAEGQLLKDAILENVVMQIRSAAMNPGGQNFAIATANLNQYFEGTSAAELALSPASRTFLARQLSPRAIADLEAGEFTIRDARHLEDCLLYRGIATRTGGEGDPLSRVRRVFDWMVRQVQLVPAGSLAVPGLGHAYARPFDVLMRGMATEAGGGWSERGWLFLSLCRQLGIDAGLLTYTPRGEKDPIPWVCAALIDGRLYLFDQRIGLAVPGRDGQGVATLDDALAVPTVLGQLDLPGQSEYQVSRAGLAASPSKIGILIDSSPGYLAPRMRLLQARLQDRQRVVLFRDPAAQRDALARALGNAAGNVALWELPVQVETWLFTDPKFVEATQKSQPFFEPDYPLVLARTRQLRGELSEAIEQYMAFSFVEDAKLRDGKTPMPPEVQHALDVHATYYLALAHLERNRPDQAAFFFQKTLRLVPARGRGGPYFDMYRFGARANLARLAMARGDSAQAVAYFMEPDPTLQFHGNLLVARDLVWRDPTDPPVSLPTLAVPAALAAPGR